MDLRDLKVSDDARRLKIVHPDDETVIYQDDEKKKPMFIDLTSADTPGYRALVHKQNNRRLKEVRVKRGGIKGISSEKSDEEALELLIFSTKHMEVIDEGEVLGKTDEEQELIYTLYPFIREQAIAFVDDRMEYMGE